MMSGGARSIVRDAPWGRDPIVALAHRLAFHSGLLKRVLAASAAFPVHLGSRRIGEVPVVGGSTTVLASSSRPRSAEYRAAIVRAFDPRLSPGLLPH